LEQSADVTGSRSHRTRIPRGRMRRRAMIPIFHGLRLPQVEA
jgi:hypothetical protein